jgi:nucleoid-associated protein YgaU
MGFLDKIKDSLQGEKKDEDGGFLDDIKDKLEGKDEAPAAPADQPEVGNGPVVTKAEPAPAEKPAPKSEKPEPKPEPKKAEPKKPAPKNDGPDFKTYTVKSGDTLSEIGAKYGVPYMEIAKLNDIENPDLIFPGQVFKIPNK